jgi:hypothetical protein
MLLLGNCAVLYGLERYCMRRWLYVVLCVCGLLLLSMWGEVDEAEACGGFFCSQAQPVNQAAERIIFSDNPDGTVTAVVQIVYQGPSERFAWVLPVPTVPTIGVSSNVAFTRLQTATNPNYTMTTTIEGTCAEATSGATSGFSADGSFSSSGGDSGGTSGGVSVVDAGTVGPYDYEVIQVNPALEDPGASGRGLAHHQRLRRDRHRPRCAAPLL